MFFFFNDTSTTELYTYLHTLSLHDALPIYDRLAVVAFVVDPKDEHRRVVLGRRRQDHLLRARVEVLLRGFLGQEQAGRLDHHVHARLVPLQVGRVALLGQADLPAVDDDVAAVDLHLALEAAVHGVVLQHVGQVVRFQQVVDGDDLDVAAEILHRRAQHVAPDAAETVDTNLDRHVTLLQGKMGKTRKGKKHAILAVSRPR